MVLISIVFPSVDKRPLDLYKLKKAVEVRGGFEKVCKDKKWAEIGRDLGYSGKIMSSLSTSLKNSYQRWLHPYEEWLKYAKPGVHQQMEFEYNGGYSPAPSQHQSPLSHPVQPQSAPPTLPTGSPTMHASMAFNTPMTAAEPPPLQPSPLPPTHIPQRPVSSSGFLAVNTGGFAAINQPSGFTAVNQTPPVIKTELNLVPPPYTSSFAAVNGPRSDVLSCRGKSRGKWLTESFEKSHEP